MNDPDNNSEFMYDTAREDLAKIIAQQTSGLIGCIPDADDYDLADKFIEDIEAFHA